MVSVITFFPQKYMHWNEFFYWYIWRMCKIQSSLKISFFLHQQLLPINFFFLIRIEFKTNFESFKLFHNELVLICIKKHAVSCSYCRIQTLVNMSQNCRPETIYTGSDSLEKPDSDPTWYYIAVYFIYLQYLINFLKIMLYIDFSQLSRVRIWFWIRSILE